jgi:hypothetical protein
LFDCVELERGKHWDGHTEEDVTRLLSLEQEPVLDKIRAEIEKETDRDDHADDYCDGYFDGMRKALTIIDKYKAESEDKENE